MKNVRNWMLPIVFGILLIAAWYAVRPVTGLSRFALPLPHEVASSIAVHWRELLPAAGRTLFSAGFGLACAIVLGMTVAFMMASRISIRTMLYPWVLVIQMMPLVVLIPLIVLWMEGIWSILCIAFLIAFFPITASAVQGLLSVDSLSLELFHMQRATWWQQTLYLRLPCALPYILTGAQISASLAIVGALTGEMFAGEVVGGRGGLGYWIILYRAEGDTAAMLGAGLMACIMGFLFVGTVQLFRRRLLGRWHESFSTRQEQLQRLR